MDLKERAKEAAERAKRFERKPPTWFYWVGGIAVILIIQAIRFL